MNLSFQNTVVRVAHPSGGDGETARQITSALRPIMRSLLKGSDPVALLHDVSVEGGAQDGYLRAWGEFAKEFKGQFLSVAIVPKAWVRVLAKTVVALSGIQLHLFANEGEALAFLREKNFHVEPNRWRPFQNQTPTA